MWWRIVPSPKTFVMTLYGYADRFYSVIYDFMYLFNVQYIWSKVQYAFSRHLTTYTFLKAVKAEVNNKIQNNVFVCIIEIYNLHMLSTRMLHIYCSTRRLHMLYTVGPGKKGMWFVFLWKVAEQNKTTIPTAITGCCGMLWDNWHCTINFVFYIYVPFSRTGMHRRTALARNVAELLSHTSVPVTGCSPCIVPNQNQQTTNNPCLGYCIWYYLNNVGQYFSSLRKRWATFDSTTEQNAVYSMTDLGPTWEWTVSFHFHWIIPYLAIEYGEWRILAVCDFPTENQEQKLNVRHRWSR